MQNIKVSELFYSIQGEGKYQGVPSVFLRTFGCNFKCGGFGMPKGQFSVERIEIAKNIQNYKDYKSLPLVNTGCDSYASWDTNFKHLSNTFDTDTIANNIVSLLPHNRWVDEHLVITGGEPLLGWQKAYPELLVREKMLGLKELTFETNGTQFLTNDFSKFIKDYWHHDKGYFTLTFSVSPKLSVSGESYDAAIKPDVISQLKQHGHTYLKFVVADEHDVNEAEQAVNDYKKAGFNGPVYLMPLGGTVETYNQHTRKIAELAMRKGYRYSARLQCDLFRNEWGT